MIRGKDSEVLYRREHKARSAQMKGSKVMKRSKQEQFITKQDKPAEEEEEGGEEEIEGGRYSYI